MKITLENNETHDLDMTIDEVKKKLGTTVPFATKADIERSFVECAEAWEVLK